MLISKKYGEIKSLKKLSSLIKKYNYEIDDLTDYSNLYNLSNLPKHLDIEYIKFILLKKHYEPILFIKYAIDVYPNFDYDRYKNYLKLSSNNKLTKCSLEWFKVKFGDEIGEEKYKDYLNNIKNRLTPYDVQYWKNKGFTNLSEINDKILNYKNEKKTSLDGFIKRHGKEKGTVLYNEWREKCSFDTNKLISIYGEEKTKQINKSKAISKQSMIKKYGEEEGNKRYENWKLSVGLTKEQMIEKHGIEKTNEIINSKLISKENFIKKYGEEEGNKRYENWKLSVGLTKEQMIEKHGIEKTNEIIKNRTHTLNNYIDKYGEIEGSFRYNIFIEKILNSNKTNSSKEADNFFLYIIKYFNIDTSVIYTSSLNKEYFLYNNETKKYYLYDFTIIKDDIKIIIEYHGTKFHPKTINDNTDNFIFLKSPQQVEEKRNYDFNKKEFAIKKGFNVLEIWSDEENKLEKIKQFLYENKIN
jgi:hypothetical protein